MTARQSEAAFARYEAVRDRALVALSVFRDGTVPLAGDLHVNALRTCRAKGLTTSGPGPRDVDRIFRLTPAGAERARALLERA